MSYARARPTCSRLEQLLHYEPATGEFTWRLSRGRVKKGQKAGCPDGQGYIAIGVDGVTYRAHVLAWCLQTGAWPHLVIDHRNTNRGDNRFNNLREATHSLNGLNRSGADCDSKSGALGVSPSRGKWKASIRVNGRTQMLGRYPSVEAASAAYMVAKQKFISEISA